MKSLQILTVFAAILIAQNFAYSQLDVWNSPDSCEWFFSQPMTQLPPLSSDMPLDIMVSWIVIDSLCRTAADDVLWQRMMTTTQDSMKLGLKYLYKLMEYDPLLLKQYRLDLDYNQVHWKTTPNSLLLFVMGAYQQRFGRVSDVIKLLMDAGYALHVRVDNITSRESWDHSHIPPGWADRFCADLYVLDNIKGKKLYPKCNELPGIRRKQSSEFERMDEQNCKRIYWGRPQRCYCIYDDSVFYEKYGPDYMKVSEEYIVFADIRPLNSNRRPVYGWKSDAIIFNYFTGSSFVSGTPRNYADSTSYGPLEPANPKFGAVPLIFPIVNGMVQDPENFFGYGIEVPVAVFKQNLRATINNFLGL